MCETTLAILVDMNAVTHVDNTSRNSIALEMMSESILAERVITVNPSGVESGPHSQPSVDRSALPIVSFTRPERDPGRILLDDLNGPVLATAIEDEIFQVRITLKKNGSDCFFNEPSLIKRRCNYRNTRPRTRVWPLLEQPRTFLCPGPTDLAARWR